MYNRFAIFLNDQKQKEIAVWSNVMCHLEYMRLNGLGLKKNGEIDFKKIISLGYFDIDMANHNFLVKTVYNKNAKKENENERLTLELIRKKYPMNRKELEGLKVNQR